MKPGDLPAATPADLARLDAALDRAAEVLATFDADTIEVQRKSGGDPVSAADHAVDAALHDVLVEPGEGWLSEESVDDPARLACERVWIVDPIDGTKYFLRGRPEWCVSIGLSVGGVAIAGGLLNPAAGHRIVGGVGHGVRLDGTPTRLKAASALADLDVLCSPTERGRDEWRPAPDAAFAVRPVGSIAWKLGLVAAGLADATWTLRPRHEWDVAGGIGLLHAAGGIAREPGADVNGYPLNRRDPRVRGVLGLSPAAAALLAGHLAAHGA